MRRGIIAATGVSLSLAGAAMAEEVEVYYCVDEQAVGIVWKKAESGKQDEGRVATFTPDRYNLRIVSSTTREVIPTTGDSQGQKQTLTCKTPWPAISEVVTCADTSGAETWAFNKGRYTRAYLYGTPLEAKFADPNIYVAHGTCTKF